MKAALLDHMVTETTFGEGSVMDGDLAISALLVPHPILEHYFALRLDGSRSVAMSVDTAGGGPLVLNHLSPLDDPRFTPAAWYAQTSALWNGPVTLGGDGLEVHL